MIENYLNKKVLISVVLSDGTINGGATTLEIVGKIISYKEDFVEIEFDPQDKLLKMSKLRHLAGKMLVRTKYISTIALI